MKDLIILVNSLDDWKPYYPSEQVVSIKDYFFNPNAYDQKGIKVINLCRKFKYLSQGYYASLMAEARGQRVIPSIKTINDLSRKKLYILDLDDLQSISLQDSESLNEKFHGINSISFRCYFGKTQEEIFKGLARQIFEQFPCPLLEVKISKSLSWKIESVIPISLSELSEEEETYFANSLDNYSTKVWRLPQTKQKYVFDLGILVNPKEKLPPSNEEALRKFEKVCADLKIYTERITKKDHGRINEFDGLFIRETTSIKDHTYYFSKLATHEGLVVMDDPDSILKCTNKIFMYNLMKKNKISQIPSVFVSDQKEDTLLDLEKSIGYPMVLKVPDGSFSIGVKKVSNQTELKTLLSEFLKKSSLVLIQKFFPTDFDWRIGVLDGEPLFACQYFMSKGHWQIYNHENKDGETNGDSTTLKIEETPRNVVELALKVTKLIGNGLYGVDIKVIDEKPMVVEVNDNPNIDHEVEDLVLGEQLYLKIAQSFLKRRETDRLQSS